MPDSLSIPRRHALGSIKSYVNYLEASLRARQMGHLSSSIGQSAGVVRPEVGEAAEVAGMTEVGGFGRRCTSC